MRISLMDFAEQQPAPEPETRNGLPLPPGLTIRAHTHGREVTLYTGRDCTGLVKHCAAHDVSCSEIHTPDALRSAARFGAVRVFSLSRIDDVPKADAGTWRRRDMWR